MTGMIMDGFWIIRGCSVLLFLLVNAGVRVGYDTVCRL